MPRIKSDQLYKSAILKYGTTAQGVCWHSTAHQQIRFDNILDMLPNDLSDTIIADAGCGFGDFYDYLHFNSKIIKKYIGIDALNEMCEIATKKPDTKIINADITKDEIPLADYYICSGALNILTTFETHQFIRNCFTSSNKGFIFNALYGDYTSDSYNYLTKEKIEMIADSLAVKKVVFIEGYVEKDITVGFFK